MDGLPVEIRTKRSVPKNSDKRARRKPKMPFLELRAGSLKTLIAGGTIA